MSYRLQHTAPDRYSGCPLYDLNANGIYPCDVYLRPHHYFDRNPHDHASWRVIAAARCQPSKRVTVYRAVPPGIRTINPGDWVALAKGYARDHAIDLMGPGQDGVVISMSVLALDLFTDGNSLNEWGYDPA